MWKALTILIAVTAAAIGCSDKDVGRDIAACRTKAMEVYKPKSVGGDNRVAEYVLDCMKVAGHQLNSKVCPVTDPWYWTLDSCYE